MADNTPDELTGGVSRRDFVALSVVAGVAAATSSVSAAALTVTETDVTITNTSNKPTVAFFIRADMRRGTSTGKPAAGDNEVLPVFWGDNDITLWPGESETMHASYRASALGGASPEVSVGAWNVATEYVAG